MAIGYQCENETVSFINDNPRQKSVGDTYLFTLEQ